MTDNHTDTIEAVLFDLDGTICRYERTPGEVLAVAFERAGVEPFFAVEAYYDRFEAFVDESDDIASLRANCFADIARERGRDPALGRAVADAFAAERDHTRVRFVEGADDALADLRDRGYPLGLVTNGPPAMQGAKLDALGVADAFGVRVFAGHDTPSKPDPEPFERALTALDTRPERTLFVGDSLDSDIAGARGVGMQTAWVAGDDSGGDSAPEVTPDHVLDSTGDLCGVLSVSGAGQ